MSEHTIDPGPYIFQTIPDDNPEVINIWVGQEGYPGVSVAGAVKGTGTRPWMITTSLADPQVPVARVETEHGARAWLVFLADLFTGRIAYNRTDSPSLAGYLAQEGVGL